MTPPSAGSRALEDRAFLFLLVAVSLAFAWILWPFFGAVLWGVILAIVFAPVYRRLLRSMRQRRTLAAIATLLVILVLVILPLTLITALLVQEGSGVYDRIQSGEFNLGRYFQQVFDALPTWVTSLLDRFGLTNLGRVQERLSSGLAKSSQFLAAQALNFGQNTLNFVLSLFIMLYLLFFLLRDGDALVERIKAAIPLHPEQQRTLASRFTGVIRATVKGTLVVAVVQGALGGLIFWLLGIHAPALWAALMALLVPAARGGNRAGLAARRHLSRGHRRDVAGHRADRVRRARHRPGGQRAASDPGREGHQDARLRRADLHAGRHCRLRRQRLRDRAGDRGLVHGRLGHVLDVASSGPPAPASG